MEQNKERNNSNIIAACIIAGGMIVASTIIAKPNMPFLMESVFLPIPLESAKQQFLTQMQAKMVGAQTDLSIGERATFKRIEIQSASYDAKARSYDIRYNLYWNDRSGRVTWTGCLIKAQGSNDNFTGSCNSVDEKTGDRTYLQKSVTVNLTPNR